MNDKYDFFQDFFPVFLTTGLAIILRLLYLIIYTKFKKLQGILNVACVFLLIFTSEKKLSDEAFACLITTMIFST